MIITRGYGSTTQVTRGYGDWTSVLGRRLYWVVRLLPRAIAVDMNTHILSVVMPDRNYRVELGIRALTVRAKQRIFNISIRRG